MAIDQQTRAEILRLYFAEKWRIGMIARQLGVHHGTVERRAYGSHYLRRGNTDASRRNWLDDLQGPYIDIRCAIQAIWSFEMKVSEQEVICEFVSCLGNLKGDSSLSIDRWPDKENRTEPEIDAIAGKFAIEHTSIDSIEEQRKRTDWFNRVVGGLDQVINNCIDPGSGFTITLDFYAIGKGMDWNSIRNDLKNWIVDHAPCLEYGIHNISLPTSNSVEFPIELHVNKLRKPAIVGFARFPPENDTLSTRIKKILDRKAKKLMKHKAASRTTILLVENDDIALMSKDKMLDALREAYPDKLPQGVDEIWFADTSWSSGTQFHDFTMGIVNEGCKPSPAR